MLLLLAAETVALVKWKHLVFDVNNTKPRTFGVFVRVVDAVCVKSTNIRTAFIINYLALVSSAVDDMDIHCCAHFHLPFVPLLLAAEAGLFISAVAMITSARKPGRVK